MTGSLNTKQPSQPEQLTGRQAFLCANILHPPAFVSEARIILEVCQAVQHSAMCRRHTITEQPPLSLAGTPDVRQQIKVVWTMQQQQQQQ
jgi:hypothetical protein